jgi:hypothetical protein
MNNPQRECSEDPNIHTYGEYTRCLNKKLLNPYTIGFEVAPSSNIVAIIVIIIILCLIIAYFSNKYSMSFMEVIISFFELIAKTIFG